MNSRSYVRILNNKRSEHANQFTTVSTSTPIKQSRRRRRLKEKKKAELEHRTHPTFDEPSIPFTANKPFQPTTILQRPPSKPSKRPLPPKRTIIHKEHYKTETHPTKKPKQRTESTVHHRKKHPLPSPHRTVQSTTPKKTAFSAQFIANGFPSVHSIKAIHQNKMSNGIAASTSPSGNIDTSYRHKDNTLTNNDNTTFVNRSMSGKHMHKRNGMNGRRTVLDGMDTDEIFNAIVGYKRNYDFPQSVSGIYKSFIWDHTIEHDNSSWDRVLKYN